MSVIRAGALVLASGLAVGCYSGPSLSGAAEQLTLSEPASAGACKAMGPVTSLWGGMSAGDNARAARTAVLNTAARLGATHVALEPPVSVSVDHQVMKSCQELEAGDEGPCVFVKVPDPPRAPDPTGATGSNADLEDRIEERRAAPHALTREPTPVRDAPGRCGDNCLVVTARTWRCP